MTWSPVHFAGRTFFLVGAVWVGAYQGNAGVGNALTGLAALECAAFGLLSYVYLTCDAKTFRRFAEKHQADAKGVPEKIVLAVDLAVLAVLVWFGWWVTAVLFAVGSFLARFARAALSVRGGKEGGAR